MTQTIHRTQKDERREEKKKKKIKIMKRTTTEIECHEIRDAPVNCPVPPFGAK